MEHIEYFKLQAKNLFRDYQTKTPHIEEVHGSSFYAYNPKYFDIFRIIVDYNLDEKNFTLMKAQHVIAIISGFDKWTDMLKASEKELNLAKLLFDYQDKIDVKSWRRYVAHIETVNNRTLSSEVRLEFFKHFFIYRNIDNSFPDYRLKKDSCRIYPEQTLSESSNLDVQITSLPLSQRDRTEFIKKADIVFEKIMGMMEARNPELTRALWDVEDYIDNLLKADMLPISREYALSLIEPLMVRLVGHLAAQADKIAMRC